MKKNGFIATSVLYTFFLLFLTLFVGLIANYIHNRVLLAKIEETSRDILYKINNRKLNELNIGDHIKFATDDNLLNSNATWIVAKIEDSGTSKMYYFISDLTAVNVRVNYQDVGDKIPKIHPLTVGLFETMKNAGEYSKSIGIKNGTYSVYPVTSSLLTGLRNDIKDPFLLAELFNPGGNYLVYVDSDIPEYTINNYYETKRYNFTSSSQTSLLESYCGGTFNNGEVIYNENNTFGYMNIDNDAINEEVKYISYCYYSSPVHYEHNFSPDHIVAYDEVKDSDILPTYTSNAYTIRLVAKREIPNGEANIYIAGGKGTSLDPYIYTDGRKQ
ncbi:MAG: hypothetical protein J1F35_00870 [Erysipelotrichales bacterium]|nr:hypothetical protein [Erysipelotrichales bacterium]